MFLFAAKPDPSDPTWLAVFGAIGVGTVLSAAITAVSLLIQNSQNGRREDRRRAEEAAERERDRENEAKIEALERRRALDTTGVTSVAVP